MPFREPSLAASAPPGPTFARRRFRRAARVAAWLLCGLLLAYGAAQAALRHACGDGALRQRIATALSTHLGPVELGPDVRVDPLFRVRFGPLTVPGTRAGDAPLVRVESIRVRPAFGRLLRTGRAVPAGVRLEGVRVELPDRPGALDELARRFGARRTRGGPGAASPAEALPAVRVRDLTVAFGVAGHRANAGPLQLLVSPRTAADGSLLVTAGVGLPGDGRVELELRREGPAWLATARLDRLDPRDLPAGLPALSATWSKGALSGRLEGRFAPARREASVRVDVATRALLVAGPMIGPEPLGPVDVGFAGELTWDGRKRTARLEDGRITLPGGSPVAVEATLELRRDLPVAVHARAEDLDYLATVEALPPDLKLPAEAPRPAGRFDAHLDVEGPLADPGAWQVDAGIDLSRMRKEARLAAPVALTRPFVQHAVPDVGEPHAFVVGPANPDFVPLGDLPPYVVRAVITCEDASFFSHSGFDFAELRNAAVEGAQAGKVVRGGSTITQQLAKNLYLTREKTLARKLREALLTVALESTVPKQRLMEVYLNIAEWGPGVWGIGPAARHWFGKDARELTPKEAAFLATVIPNPVRYHYMWSRGFLSEHWEERVEGLLRAMYDQGVLSEDELARSLSQPLTFARCAAGAEAPATRVTCRGT
jgi:hypothetical protein